MTIPFLLLRPRRPTLPPVAVSLALALIWVAFGWHAESVDIGAYIVPWFDHIAATGPVAAFAEPFSNYTPPYLYLLALATVGQGLLPVVALAKIIGLVGAAAMALAVCRLLLSLDHPQPGRGAALAFALPSVVINAGVLGQCDPWWAAAAILAVAAAVDRRHAAMLGWFGLAVAIKAQALFAAPFFLGLLIQRRVPLRVWPVAPLAAAAAMLPAALAGWPVGDLATIYLRQADTFTLLSCNAPNIWAILQPLAGAVPLTGLALAAAIGAAAAYTAWLTTRRIEGAELIAAALLAPLLVAGLLPRMHERYFFLADILALVFALVSRDRHRWHVAALVQAGSVLALFAFMARIDALAILGALAMIAATVLVARPLLRPAANDNPVYPRAVIAA